MAVRSVGWSRAAWAAVAATVWLLGSASCALPEATKVDTQATSGSTTGGAGGTAGAGGTGSGGTAGAGGAGPCDALAPPLMREVPGPVNSFCIDSTEVTRGQYGAFFSAITTGGDKPDKPQSCIWNDDFLPGPPPAKATDDHPVTAIDWCDAHAYCVWAGKRLCGAFGGGHADYTAGMDPATDEMWFLACSAGYKQAYPYGNTYDPTACNDANFGADEALPVKSLEACEGGYSGVFDMYGNVVEWLDACDDYSGASDTCLARGGSYFSAQVQCDGTAAIARNARFNNIGFRCCKDIVE